MWNCVRASLSTRAAVRLVVLGLAAFVPSAAPAASPEIEMARRLNDAFVQVAESVSPAVVVVRVWQKPDAERDSDLGGLFRFLPEEMRKEMEKEMREREKERDRERAPRDREPDQGSGVVLRENGYILTNGHVVENAERIEVRMKDGRRFPAEVKGLDVESDLAVIKVDASGLPAAKLGDSQKVRVGEFAIAIGAPFDLEYSVTFGHVSAKGRRVLSDIVMMEQDFIQTDASINPGNSGGPLVNIEGEVIGINSMIRGMNTGIGFAVPVNLAREITDRLIESGHFTRAWLGVGIETVREWAEGHPGSGISATEGVVVTHIRRDGPSWGTELKTGDVIVAIDGQAVRDVTDLKRQVSRKPVGKPVAVEVYRADKKVALELTPGELPENRFASRMGPSHPPIPAPDSGPGREPGVKGSDVGPLGVAVRELDEENAKRVGLERGEGVLIVEVEADSPAAAKRIRVGEVITKLNRRTVASEKEFEKAARDADLGRGVSVTVVGEKGRRIEVLRRSAE